MPPDNHELVEQPRFAANKAKIQPDAKRMDEALRGIGFFLSRRPDKGYKLENSSIWAIATDPLPGSTPLVIFYRFDERQVFLEDIILAKPPDA